jgi:hypothetical protein
VSGRQGHTDPAFTLRTKVHLMDAGLGDADALDTAVERPDRGNDQGSSVIAPSPLGGVTRALAEGVGGGH